MNWTEQSQVQGFPFRVIWWNLGTSEMPRLFRKSVGEREYLLFGGKFCKAIRFNFGTRIVLSLLWFLSVWPDGGEGNSGRIVRWKKQSKNVSYKTEFIIGKLSFCFINPRNLCSWWFLPRGVRINSHRDQYSWWDTFWDKTQQLIFDIKDPPPPNIKVGITKFSPNVYLVGKIDQATWAAVQDCFAVVLYWKVNDSRNGLTY